MLRRRLYYKIRRKVPYRNREQQKRKKQTDFSNSLSHLQALLLSSSSDSQYISLIYIILIHYVSLYRFCQEKEKGSLLRDPYKQIYPYEFSISIKPSLSIFFPIFSIRIHSYLSSVTKCFTPSIGCNSSVRKNSG